MRLYNILHNILRIVGGLNMPLLRHIGEYEKVSGIMDTRVWQSPYRTVTWTAPHRGIFLITMTIESVNDTLTGADVAGAYKQFRWTGTAKPIFDPILGFDTPSRKMGLYFRGSGIPDRGINAFTWTFPVECSQAGDTVIADMWTDLVNTYYVGIVAITINCWDNWS